MIGGGSDSFVLESTLPDFLYDSSYYSTVRTNKNSPKRGASSFVAERGLFKTLFKTAPLNDLCCCWLLLVIDGVVRLKPDTAEVDRRREKAPIRFIVQVRAG